MEIYTAVHTIHPLEQIRSLMAAMIGKPKLALSSQDFTSFLEYYERLRRGDKQGAALLADNRDKH